MESKPRQHILIQDESKRLIAGWASVEVKDLQNDIIPVGVLERAMYNYMSRGGIVMYGHENIPVGKVVRWEIRNHPETGKPGLWIEVEIYRDSQVADAIWNEIKSGNLLGFSISGVGHEEKNKEIEIDGRKEIADIIVELELLEISVVQNPANPYARIEYINYMAKGTVSECESMAVKMGIANPSDFCKWAETVYRQYGYSELGKFIEWVGTITSTRISAGEGTITTETPGAHNPTYGGNPTPQLPIQTTPMDEDEKRRRKPDEDGEKEKQVNLEDEDTPATQQITEEEEGGEEVKPARRPLPKPEETKPESAIEVKPSEVVEVKPEAKPEPQIPEEKLEVVRQLVAELREILNVLRGMVRDEDRQKA